MSRRGIPRDAILANVMLSALVRSQHYHAALELFYEVENPESGFSPDVYTYSTVIDACARGRLGLEQALGLFRQVSG